MRSASRAMESGRAAWATKARAASGVSVVAAIAQTSVPMMRPSQTISSGVPLCDSSKKRPLNPAAMTARPSASIRAGSAGSDHHRISSRIASSRRKASRSPRSVLSNP
jgi:hypothetical protein